MDTAEYEREPVIAGQRRIEDNEREGWSLAGLGLAGEAGEAADLIKKHLHHAAPLDRDKLKKELGDVLWYLTLACRLGGFTLEDVMRTNIAKLRARHPNGWSPESQRAKADEVPT